MFLTRVGLDWTALLNDLEPLFFHCISFPQPPITWHWWLKYSRGIQVFQVVWQPLIWIRICVINPGQVRHLFDLNNITHQKQLVLYFTFIQQGIQQLSAYLIYCIPLDKGASEMTVNQVCLISLFSDGLSPQGTSTPYQVHLQLPLAIWTEGTKHFHSHLSSVLFRSHYCCFLYCNFQNQIRIDYISKQIFKIFLNFPSLYKVVCSMHSLIFLFTACWGLEFWARVFLLASHTYSCAKTLMQLNFMPTVPLKTPDNTRSRLH